MNWIILLYIVGLVFVCAEIFVPGAVCGIIGTACIIISIVMCYSVKGPEFGSYFLTGAVIITGIGILLASKLFPKTKMGKSLTLQSSETNYSSGKDNSYLLNKTGLAISYLRPSGIVEIDGERIDVVTEGAFIERGSHIKVVEVEGARIVVRGIQKEIT
jgi:membrane-bound serine protease (ClpP class)